MKRIKLHPEAEEDIEQAVSYYEERRSGYGSKFLDNYVSATSFIRQFPESGTRYYERVLFTTLNDFPYSIFYLNLERSIFVLAVIHDRRRPGFWLDRLKGAQFD